MLVRSYTGLKMSISWLKLSEAIGIVAPAAIFPGLQVEGAKHCLLFPLD
jgi:hypothetical protein